MCVSQITDIYYISAIKAWTAFKLHHLTAKDQGNSFAHNMSNFADE